MTVRSVLLGGLAGCILSGAQAEILISQYYEGSTGNNKWIELVNTDSSPVWLDGYVMTSWANAAAEGWKINGANPTNREDLSGFSIAGNGNFLIGNPDSNVPAYAVADLTSAVTFINGNDSVVLYNTALGAVGDTAAIVDALSFTEAGSEGEDTSIYRLGTGVGHDLVAGSTFLAYPAVWGERTEAEVQNASPGQEWYLHNFASTATESLEVTLSPTTIAEDGGTGLVDVTVTRTGSTDAALDVVLGSSDPGEAQIPVTKREIPAGQAGETFAMAIDGVDDTLADGPQTVTIAASAAGFLTGSAELTVTDDGDVAVLAINEVLADPPTGAAGDANRDGTTNSGQDEFVELVNISGADLDISFWELHDGFSLRHIFPLGTELGPGCAVVVFGGGSVDFLGGAAIYQTATNGGLSLDNGGDTITVFDELLSPVASLTYGAEGGNDQSLTRSPDTTGSFVGHTSAVGGLGAFSPGTMVDGTEFCPPLGVLSISLSAPSMSENGGSITATISRTGDPSEELEVIIKIDDPSEAETDLIIPEIEFIPAGESSVDVTINAVDDVAADGTQTVTVTAKAVRHDLGVATFDVLDDGDGEFTEIVINEFLYDPAGGDAGDANGDGTRDGSDDEFVELLNVSDAPFDLTGYQIQDLVATRHEFPFGTVLAPGQAIVVFGGGSPSGTFGGSLVQTASTGFLGLNNGGDTVILASPDGTPLVSVAYDGSIGGEALTRDPDQTGNFVAHSAASGSGGALFSPGTKIDGSNFAGGSSGPSFEIVALDVDRGAETVTVQVVGLQPAVTYDFESSLDLGESDFFEFILLFTIDDGTEVNPGVYEFVFPDPSLATVPEQFYRVSQF